MGDKVELTVEERTMLGKKVKQLRKQGYIPAVLYGHEVPAQAVMASATDAAKVWRSAGKRTPIELTVGGKKRLAMIKNADLHPVKRNLRHLSLHIVKQNEKVETEVPVHIAGEGETEAEKAGLVILQAIESVQIAALPKNLPDFMAVDGAKFTAAGDHATVADITPAEGVTVLSDPEQIVATVYEPSALQAQNEAAAGDASNETEVESENGALAEGETTEGTEGDAQPKNEK